LVGEGVEHRSQRPYPVDWGGGEASLVDKRWPDRIRRPTDGDQGSRFGSFRENLPVDIVLTVYKDRTKSILESVRTRTPWQRLGP
jgi:hypothetical protein